MIDRRFLRVLLAVLFACTVLPSLLFKLISSPSSAEEEEPTQLSYNLSQSRNNRSANISTSEIGLFISCKKPPLDDFPSDVMTQQQRQKGGVALHVFLAFYMVLAIAVACEDYFVPSLEQITDKLQMNSDVAGATLMAVGSSAPEFFTSSIGAFITKSDIGLDTIVGSCTYNILFVVAVSGLASGSAVRMSRWSLLRDSLCYLLSIVALVVICNDKKVYWYEAFVMVCMYLLYTIFMYFNEPLQNYFHRIGTSDSESVLTNDASSEKKGLLPKEDESSRSFSVDIQYSQEVKETDENNASPFSFPQGTISRALWIIALPIKCLFFLTIPDCRKARWGNWYLVSFTVSLIWIGSFTYVLVWMVTIIGFTAGIPTVIFAFTLLAAGCSAPECLSSAIVARKGYGDMAVAQTLGSNIFDILLCLGLPWFLRTVVEGDHVNVVSGSIFYSTLCLFGTVILLILCLILNKWYLNKFLAVILFFFYMCYVSIATLFGLNVFGDFNRPTCKR